MITIRPHTAEPTTPIDDKASVPFETLECLVMKPHLLSMRAMADFFGVGAATCYRWRALNDAPLMYGYQAEMFSQLPHDMQVAFLECTVEHKFRYSPTACVERMEAFGDKYRLSRLQLAAVFGVGTTTMYDYANQRRAPVCIWMQLEIADSMTGDAVNEWVNTRLRESR